MRELETSLFDSIAGLPLHPLVVHVAVVLLPLAALGLLALLARRPWADRFGWLTLGAMAIGTGAAFVAKQSGEALAAQVGEPATHAAWGDVLPMAALALLAVSLAWYLVQRRNAHRSLLSSALGVVAGVGAVAVVALTVLVGHSGAEAVWAGSTTSDASVSAATPSGAPSSVAGAAPSASGPASALTVTEVAKHGDAASCWSVVNGSVYDLTDWINKHPGGARRILSMCGKDASAAFTAQHGGEARPEAIRKQFLVGKLG